MDNGRYEIQLTKIIRNTKLLAPDFIQKKICEYFDIPLSAMMSRSRTHGWVVARHLSVYFFKNLTSYSLQKIGQFHGSRDHSTIIHSINWVNDKMMITGSKEQKFVNELKEIFGVEFKGRFINEVDPVYIQNKICEYLNMPTSVLSENDRNRDKVYARKLSMYFMRKNTTLSYKDIGLLHGSRDHSTIIASLDFIKDQLSIHDRQVTEDVENLTNIIKEKL